MPEAEVSLRLAFFLIDRRLATSNIRVAIDGAQVKTGNTIHFSIAEFFQREGWSKTVNDAGWQGVYFHPRHRYQIIVHSNPGRGDVVAHIQGGQTLRVECKKGPLVRSKSSQEYPLLREALGQLLTVKSVTNHDILAVAVPESQKFADLARQWRQAPLIKKFHINILTVSRSNKVNGLFIETF